MVSLCLLYQNFDLKNNRTLSPEKMSAAYVLQVQCVPQALHSPRHVLKEGIAPRAVERQLGYTSVKKVGGFLSIL